jgi:hypothetical protein
MKLPSSSLGRQAFARGPGFRRNLPGRRAAGEPGRARSGAGVTAEMRTDDCQSLSFFETEMTNRAMAIKNNIMASIKFGALMR